jgi:hypothetical protein
MTDPMVVVVGERLDHAVGVDAPFDVGLELSR